MVSLLLPTAPPMFSQCFMLSCHSSVSPLFSLRASYPLFSLPFSTFSAPSPSTLPSVYCGRGDRKTAKGKRFSHSYGNARPRNKKKGRGPPKVPVPPVPNQKKDTFDDDEVIKIDIDESSVVG